MTLDRAGILGSVVALASTVALAAQAADVDWKMYGGMSAPEAEICFYDAMGIGRTPDALLRVWTKCLPQSDMDAIDIKTDFGGKILENTARKMLRPYIPPYARVESFDFERGATITQYEETANISGIKPHSTIFYELNCSQKMLRELSVSIDLNGRQGFLNKPSEWKFVPPESNGTALLKILCPAGGSR